MLIGPDVARRSFVLGAQLVTSATKSQRLRRRNSVESGVAKLDIIRALGVDLLVFARAEGLRGVVLLTLSSGDGAFETADDTTRRPLRG